MGFFCYIVISSDLITINGNWSGLDIKLWMWWKIGAVITLILHNDTSLWQLFSTFRYTFSCWQCQIKKKKKTRTHKISNMCSNFLFDYDCSIDSGVHTVYSASQAICWAWQRERFPSKPNDDWLYFIESIRIFSLVLPSHLILCSKKAARMGEKILLNV